MSKLKLFISLLIISSLFVSCEEDEKIDITGISFKENTLTVTEGVSYDANEYLEVAGGDADQANFTFTSGDANVVSVNGTILTAKAIGSTTLTATETNSNQSATVNVEVIAKVVEVTGISLDKETADLKVGETLQLSASIAPVDATEQGVVWTVNFDSGAKTREDEPTDIATVSNDGLVTAIAAGTVVVTATSKDGGFTAKAAVSITTVPVESVSIDQESIDVVGNAEVQLTATILPENATNKKVTWSLELNQVLARSEKAIDASYYAEIDAETGLLKGKKDCDGCGLTVVVTTEEGAKSGNRSANVTYVPVTEIVVSPSPVDIKVGDTQQMTATITPNNANIQTVDWSINGTTNCFRSEVLAAPAATDFATVDENGILTAIKENDYYCDIEVVASVEDGVSTNVTVNISNVIATSVTIDQGNEPIELELGGTVTLTASVLPANTTDAQIKWYDYDPNAVARVAAPCDPTSVDVNTGLVTASSNCTGTTTIFAYNPDSGKTDSIEINVVCGSECL